MIDRLPRLRAALVLTVLVAPAAFLSARPALSQPDGLEQRTDRYQEAEAAAIDALRFDPWTIEDGDLIRRQVLVMANLPIQFIGLSQVTDAATEARDRVDTATVRKDRAVRERDELHELLEKLAISTFVLTDDGSAGRPRAEVDRLRRDVPLQAITDDLVGEVIDARVELRSAEASLAYAQAVSLQRAREQLHHEAALERARNAVTQFQAMADERNEAIELRRIETLEAEKPAYELTKVEGFTVNASLAAPLQALLLHAREDGIELGGWGWRSTEQQIVLREAHCGTSGYALFDRPAGECVPPTARPLHSQHEIGLAVDFTENGATLNHSSPAFLWLQENGAEYGFFNLPSEAWHWSTTGH